MWTEEGDPGDHETGTRRLWVVGQFLRGRPLGGGVSNASGTTPEVWLFVRRLGGAVSGVTQTGRSTPVAGCVTKGQGESHCNVPN